MSEDANKDCSLFESNCTFVALSGCRFIKNKASEAGGAIFASYPRVFRYSCSPIETENPLEPYSDDTLVSMKPLSSNRTPCESWIGNKAKIYGDNVGSYARSVKILEITESGDVVSEINIDTYAVRNHRSGTTLPGIEIQLRDEYDQGPVFGNGNRTVEATMHSTDELFVGSIIVPFKNGKGIFTGIRGYGKPGTYTVTIDFNVTTLESFSYNVTVRECQIDEQATRDQSLCINCTTDQYKFDLSPHSVCRPCPEHANCSTTVIHPQSNYFHWYPCSTHLQPCLTRDGCNSRERAADIKAVTRKMTDCTVDDNRMRSYHEAQCNVVSVKRLSEASY